MKEHGNKHPAEPAAKTLKSLLKKPGQTKAKSQKHRVVINEKLNEFFAADYIILIKEECCADYEEDCDCCYQEHEFMRLGNCKECRAELNLHFGLGNGRYGEMPRGVEQALRETAARPGTRGKNQQGREDSQEDDDEEDEEEADDGEEEEDDEEEREDEEEDEVENVDGKTERMATATERTTTSVEGKNASERKDAEDGTKGRSRSKETVQDSQEENGSVVPPPPTPPPRHEQQETLSPPEGYKDVCSNSEIANETEQRTCTECNYYQQQATQGESNSLS